MSSCKVYIDEEEYFGEYHIDNENLCVDIYDYFNDTEEDDFSGNKEMIICDYRNSQFFYSSTFYCSRKTYGLAQYETFQTNFYLNTSRYENIENFSFDFKVKSLTFYHPLFINFFTSQTLKTKHSDDKIEVTLKTKYDSKEVLIQKNNIELMSFGEAFSYKRKREKRQLVIETENYVKLSLMEPILFENILSYINEFDIIVNSYLPTGVRSYKIVINTDEDKTYRLFHKRIGREEHYNKILQPVVKMDFFDYMKHIYTLISFREVDNRNRYLPLDFRKPITLEDKFIYYFRCVDLYMGDLIMKETKEKSSNYKRLERFIDDNLDLFSENDLGLYSDFKNEINSLRNHYIHEGYYLPNNELEVKGKNQKFLYKKKIDYMWLDNVTTALQLGVHRMLYTKVLNVDIDEQALKNCKL